MIDPSSKVNLISKELVIKHQLPLIELKRPLVLTNGTSPTKEHFTHRTIIPVVIAKRRHRVSFLVSSDRNRPLTLGLSWLANENPRINWKTGLLQWKSEQLEVNTYSARLYPFNPG